MVAMGESPLKSDVWNETFAATCGKRFAITPGVTGGSTYGAEKAGYVSGPAWPGGFCQSGGERRVNGG
jgi:hypothetical protein